MRFIGPLASRAIGAVSLCAVLVSAPLAADAMATCSFSYASILFGSYSVFNTAPNDGSGSISGYCSVSDPVTIALSAGDSGSTTQRFMKSASASTLDYNLYQTSSYTTIWGSGTSALSTTFGKTTRTLTIYGMLPAQQDVTAGAYSDTVTATISY